ncbi:MAG: FCSD flavin-binding domain-containing protein [Magnetococcales bacterium]|nr:FCSD flavin-binding domain-containing protein [Magnetococcales bacterium]
MSQFTRRTFLKLTGGAAAVTASGLYLPSIGRAAAPRVVVVGGGYGGAVAAKYVKKGLPSADVTLIEMNEKYISCPLSNPVLVGHRDMKVQTWGYEGLKKHGINVVIDEVTGIDAAAKKVTTKGGKSFEYDKLVVSPGVELKFGAIEGFSAEAAEKMPHAWKAGPQTLLLKKQLESMTDGDPFIIVAPPNPFRCPPGPYERASLVAHWMKKHKPKSKVIILDAKDAFAKQPLFVSGWKELGLNVEWKKGAEGGKVTKIDVAGMTVTAGDMGDTYKSSCINVIPPQVAGHIAHVGGLVNDKGWCPVNPATCESTLHKDVYVIGDACAIAGLTDKDALPKSGYAANSEAKVAAANIVAALSGKEAGDPSYANTCYSILTPDYGISVAHIGGVSEGKLKITSTAISPPSADLGAGKDTFRKQEAIYAEGWYQSIMADTFA